MGGWFRSETGSVQTQEEAIETKDVEMNEDKPVQVKAEVKEEVVTLDAKKDKIKTFHGNGSLMHIGAVGMADQELNISAQKTIFKEEKLRSTNYAHEWILLEAERISNSFERDQLSLSWQIQRQADLVNGLLIYVFVEEDAFNMVPFATALPYDHQSPFSSYFQTEPATNQTADTLQCVKLVTAELKVGNQIIETLYGEMETFKGNVVEQISGVIRDGKSYTLFKVPVRFSIMGTSSSAPLPLISVQFHEVRVKVNLDVFEVWHNFIFLQNEERRLFAQQRHQYVIEQTQAFSTTEEHKQGLVGFRLCFNHPCIYLIFTVKDARGLDVDFRRISAVKLLLNKCERMQGPGFMFLAQHPSDHPGISTVPQHANTYMIKFKAPNSSHHDHTSLPHGTLNLSKIDHVKLLIKIEGAREGEMFTVDVFCQTTNVANISGGMMRPKYANN